MSQTKKFVLDLSGNYTSEVLYEMYSFGCLGLVLKCCLKFQTTFYIRNITTG